MDHAFIEASDFAAGVAWHRRGAGDRAARENGRSGRIAGRLGRLQLIAISDRRDGLEERAPLAEGSACISVGRNRMQISAMDD